MIAGSHVALILLVLVFLSKGSSPPLPGIDAWSYVCDLIEFGADTLSKGGTQAYASRSYPAGMIPYMWTLIVNASETSNGTMVTHSIPVGSTIIGYDPNGSGKDLVDCDVFLTVDSYFRWRQSRVQRKYGDWVSSYRSPTEMFEGVFLNGSAVLVQCSVLQQMYDIYQIAYPSLAAGTILTRSIGRLPAAFNASDASALELLDEFQQQFRSGFLQGAAFGGRLYLDVYINASAVAAGVLSPRDLYAYAGAVASNLAWNRSTFAGTPTQFSTNVIAAGTGDEGVAAFSVVQGGQHAYTNTSVAEWRQSLVQSPGILRWTCGPWDDILTDPAMQAYRAVLSQYRAYRQGLYAREVQAELSGLRATAMAKTGGLREEDLAMDEGSGRDFV